MTPRERVLKTFRFEQTDRVPYDLMEGSTWPELMEYFGKKHNIETDDELFNFLGTDFRWVCMSYEGPKPDPAATDAPDSKEETYSWAVARGPMAEAATVDEVDPHGGEDAAWWQPPDFAGIRRRWPDHALVFFPGWMPLFWGACLAFGMEAAMVNIIERPHLIEAFVRRRHQFYTDLLRRGLEAARGICDICWLGDDFAGQKNMLINPDLWRRFVKPYLAEQVQLARENEMYVLFHSCGAVRPILPDLIDIGVNGLLVFQTTAAGMDAESIAAEFGGRLAFYGGIDVQQLLSYGSAEEVEVRVRANANAFADCGGYIVANSHHCVKTIKGENIEAMCRAARACVPRVSVSCKDNPN